MPDEPVTTHELNIQHTVQTPPTVEIPVGLGTKLGIGTGVIGTFIAALTAVLHGDHTPVTITALVIAALAVIRTIDGRMQQATAALKDAPSAKQLLGDARPLAEKVLAALEDEAASLVPPDAHLDTLYNGDPPPNDPAETVDPDTDAPGPEGDALPDPEAEFDEPAQPPQVQPSQTPPPGA